MTVGINFSGYVLRPPRIAPGNANSTGEPSNGVVRDIRVPPERTAAQPVIVDLAGDQYRAAVLQAPGSATPEYLVWAANTSQLALLDDPAWWSSQGTGAIPQGTLQVGAFLDGTRRVIVTDEGQRDIGTILHVVVARGDQEYEDEGWLDPEDPSQGRKGAAPFEVILPGNQQRNGVVTLTNSNGFQGNDLSQPVNLATLFDGGLSQERGDAVVAVRYTVAPCRFWYTRNDRYETRFGWNDRLQRWAPYKGAPPVNLGPLAEDTIYLLSPKPKALPLGAFLTGDGANPDSFASLRVGTSPGVTAIAVGTNGPGGFQGVRIVADVEVDDAEFEATSSAAILGQTSGRLRFNPRFVQRYAGQTVWYTNSEFTSTANGILGLIRGSDRTPLFLAPPPGPTDHPFIRIGNRTPLRVQVVETEADLPLSLTEGSCAVARSTGRLKFAQTDIDKANPEKLEAFDKLWLGAQVVYDGVALNEIAQGTKAPVALVQSDGITETVHPSQFMYLPPGNPFTGLSGVWFGPDGTGAVPNPEGVDPSVVPIPVRPGGDSLPPPGGGVPPQSLGLVRNIHDEVGETILFSRQGALEEIQVVNRNSEVPHLPLNLRKGKVTIAREGTEINGVFYSRVQLSLQDRKRFKGEPVYFLQASLNPSTYTEKAQIFSRTRLIFRFTGTEAFYFAIDGVSHDWLSSSLPEQSYYTPGEVAASLQARIVAQGGTGVCRVVGDRVVLEAADIRSGVVEIGWGDPKDLSGAAALGYLPGWRVVGDQPNWLSDSGVSFGLSRSLLNLDRSQAVPDYRHHVRLEETVIQDAVQPNPFVFLDQTPLEDLPGYDVGVFFNLQNVTLQGEDLQVVDRFLQHFGDVEYRFAEGKFAWLSQTVSSQRIERPTSTLSLGVPGVVPESLLNAPGIPGGLLLAENGGRYSLQTQGKDYLLPDEGLSGIAQLVHRYGARVLYGGKGSAVGGAFFDTSADFLAPSTNPDIDPSTGRQRVVNGQLVWLPVVQVGFRLKVDSLSYLITEVPSATSLVVSPPITTTDKPLSWEIFEGISREAYDPALVADIVYQTFNHLPSEPFRIRTLTPLGTLDGTDFSGHVQETLAQDRPLSLRFGATHEPGAIVTLLTLTPLGGLANNTLVIPLTQHVQEGAFLIRIGALDFTPEAVASFSANPVSIEYLTEGWMGHPRGELKFNATLLSDLESSEVVMVETFRAANLLSPGQAELNPWTGALRVASQDATTFSGQTLYLVEEMQVGPDVSISPLIGAVSFRKPINRGVLVEMQYWLADSEGKRIGEEQTEFLPVFVRRETPTRNSDRVFLSAPGVIDTRIEPLVYLGPQRQNFGSTQDFTWRVENSRLRLEFHRDIPDWVEPTMTYGVFDAHGGERTYESSQKPIYRPPFFIPANKDNFGVRGDRSNDFLPGQLLRLGGECLYITGTSYFPASHVTRVDFYPPTRVELGSRSPGNDILTLVSSAPVTKVLFPDAETPVETTAYAGFMQELVGFPFEPVNANQNRIVFLGDISRFAVPGHLLEISGMPFTVASATLSEDGTRTILTLTAPFRSAIDPAGSPTVKLSYRPLYPPETRVFLGVGPVLTTEPLELVRFEEGAPGKTLNKGVEWDIDPDSGQVHLLTPLTEALKPGQWLYLAHTQVRVLQPFYSGGQLVFPRWAANFRHNVIPSRENQFLAGRLCAQYTFEQPDTFYFRIPTLRAYLSEAVEQALEELRQSQPAYGPRLSFGAPSENWQQGRLGLTGLQRDLSDKDRAARTLLLFYNKTIQSLEQIKETISGGFIGDRSGKFRFWVGQGKDYPAPGFEDEISGRLFPFNVWSTLFNAQDSNRDIQFLAGVDPLIRPESCVMSDLMLTGQALSSARLANLIARQYPLVRNDIDDVVLLGAGIIRVETRYPQRVLPLGLYAPMGDPHRLSRLFPTSTGVFFSLMPGIGSDEDDPGVYAWRKVNPETGQVESTHREQIGQVGNPVLGELQNLSSTVLRPRMPRARIFGYFPSGLPEEVFGTTITTPCLVVSLVPLGEFPLNPETGFPQPTRFLSQDPGGTFPDAEAGNPSLSLPGFQVGQRIALAKPDGRILEAVFPEEVDVQGTPIFTGVFVESVQFGCVLTFRNRLGETITDPQDILIATAPTEGTPFHLFPIEQADTVYTVPADMDFPAEQLTADTTELAALQAPSFRLGFDMSVQTDGRLLDLSLPSKLDPALFPIKEILGQKTPTPQSHLEGETDFANLRQLPLVIPALEGEARNDFGDETVPFLKGTVTEFQRFDEILNAAGPLMRADPFNGGYYPDEILFQDGEVLDEAVLIAGGDYREPAVLMTQTRTNPDPTFGVAPAREGDLVILEVNPANPQGWQGILSIGSLRNKNTGGADWSWIEPPRFVTPVSQGSPIRYTLDNYAVHTTPGDYPPNPQTTDPAGVRLFDDIANGNTVLSFQDVVLGLNDGDTIGAGNLNTILAADPTNILRVNLISRPDDTVVNGPAGAVSIGDMKDGRVFLTIEIRQGDARVIDYQGNDTGWIAHGGVTFGDFDPVGGEGAPGTVADHRHIILTGWSGVLPFTPSVGTESQWFLPHEHLDPGGGADRKISLYGWEFALSIDTTQGWSLSAFIDSDRLTFHEVVDFRSSRPRGFQHDNGAGPHVYETGLRVATVWLGSGVFSTVNDVAGMPLTFVSRTGSDTGIEGTWNPAPSPGEEGSLRAMAFEFENTPIVASDIVASVLASQSFDQTGTAILGGNGVAEKNRIHTITALGGSSLANVEKGDVVYIDRSDDTLVDSATEKAGTYLTRFAVATTDPYLEVSRNASLGTGGGFVTTFFPRVLSLNVAGNRLGVHDHTMLPATGKVFVVLSAEGLADADALVFQQSLFSVNYTGFDLGGPHPQLILGSSDTWRWADDTIIADPLTEILEESVVGRRLAWHGTPVNGALPSSSGVMEVSVSVRGGPLPDDSSVVGYHLPGGGAGNASYGFHELKYQTSRGEVIVAVAQLLDGGVSPVPGDGEVSVFESPIHDNETYDPTGAAVVYPEVPVRLRIKVSAAQGQTLNDPQGHLGVGNHGVSVLLPGTNLNLSAFFAASGVFLEPSLPSYPHNLNPASGPQVVDAGRSVSPVGMVNPLIPEAVHFEVRRVRRWHGVQNGVNNAFGPLKYAYEIRRGIVTAFSRNEQQVGLVTASAFTMNWNEANPAAPLAPDVWNDLKVYTGTNLGPFNSEDVNIHPGDAFRVLDEEGAILAEGLVQEVVDNQTLKISPPGLPEIAQADIPGLRFEVWLRQAPVPHEQSHEELLALVTDRVVLNRRADYSDPDPQNWTGGYVPETDGASTWAEVANQLFDDALPALNFQTAGVRKGDILVIDPAGTLPVVEEKGFRPLGDRSVPVRTAVGGPNPYLSGAVSSLDDNRGFYTVESVEGDHLTLNPVHLFGGTLGSDVILGETRTNLAYAVLPTVNNSVLSTDGAEGQNDLRPTRKAENGSFKDVGDAVKDKHSLRPFSYRILRPSGVFSAEVVQTVLFFRERLLSLIEMFRSATQGGRGGFYYDWQTGEHVEDMGSPTDPESGLGLFPNRLLTTLLGETSLSPFVNTSDCLSVLDRRFWIGDTRLDSLEPDPDNPFGMQLASGAIPFDEVGGPYSAFEDTEVATGGSEVRPVLPDHLEMILNSRDRLRDIRYTWLVYRTHRIIGTLARIRTFEEEIPRRLADRKRAVLLEETSK